MVVRALASHCSIARLASHVLLTEGDRKLVQKETLTDGGGGRQDNQTLEKRQPVTEFWLPLGLRKQSTSRCSNDEEHEAGMIQHTTQPRDVLPTPEVIVSSLKMEAGLTHSTVLSCSTLHTLPRSRLFLGHLFPAGCTPAALTLILTHNASEHLRRSGILV